MAWKAAHAEDPFAPDLPRLSVVEGTVRTEPRFLVQLGLGWAAVLVVLAVGAVLVAAQLVG